jgi:hypothetical protein
MFNFSVQLKSGKRQHPFEMVEQAGAFAVGRLVALTGAN